MLFQSMNIHLEDMVSIKEFFEHAQLHKQNHNDSFLTFISKHYGDLKEIHKKEHQEEEKNHEHSPINHNCSSQLPVDLAFEVYQIHIPKISLEIESQSNFYYKDLFSTFEKEKIFQPPRS
jgi:hypothetical protein